MPAQEPPHEETPPPASYADLLGEAADVSAKALHRLYELRERYPAEFPPPVLEQVRRAHSDPEAERRRAVRLPAHPEEASVRSAGGLDAAAVVDRCPEGVSLRLGFMVLPGATLDVKFPSAGEWVPVEVRHARPDRGAWVAGCVYVDGPPTL